MTYEVVLAPDAPRLDWLKWRQEGIGGSDIAAIVGVSPWKTSLSVWVDKTGDVDKDDEPSEAAEWGIRLEHVVVQAFADKHPEWLVMGSPGLCRSLDYPFMLATPDGMISTSGDGNADRILEIKTTSLRQKEAWSDGIPDHYMTQACWYCETLGKDTVEFATLIGGQNYVERTYVHDKALGEMLRIRAEKWWDDHIIEGRRPDPDLDRDGALLNAIYDAQKGMPKEIGEDSRALFAELLDIKRQVAALYQRKEHVENSLKATLGEATEGTYGGETLFSWRPTSARHLVDSDRLKAEYPGVYAAVLKTTNPTRTFRIHTKGK